MENKIYIIGEINNETVKNVINRLDEYKTKISDKNKLYVYIDSEGGNVESLKVILELLNKYKDNLVTIALNSCQSSAAFIFLLGKERLIINESTFLLHRPAYLPEDFISNVDRVSIPLLEYRLKILKDDEKWMKAFFKEHHLPKDLIHRIFSQDQDIIVTVENMLKHNIATKLCNIDYNIRI